MEYRNELLDKWLGESVLIKHVNAPEPDDSEQLTHMFNDPGYGIGGMAKHFIAFYELISYDSIGIVARIPGEHDPPSFMPWSAVISIQEVPQRYDEPEQET